MWALAVPAPLNIVPLLLEMLVFCCTHAEGSAAWKTGCFTQAPVLVALVMKDGFQTILGAITVAGLHFLPLWLWLAPRIPHWPLVSSPLLGVPLAIGRVLGLIVEVWVIMRHVTSVIQRDDAVLKKRLSSEETTR